MINTFQGKKGAWIANMREDRKETTFCQETTEARLECEKPTSAGMMACQETTACHEATDANLENTEPDPGKMQFVVEHQEVPKDDAIVKPVKARRKRRRGRKLTAGRRGEPKELTRGDCGSERKLAASYRKMSRHSAVAQRKRNVIRKIGTQKI
jgi:hypothetical protein